MNKEDIKIGQKIYLDSSIYLLDENESIIQEIYSYGIVRLKYDDYPRSVLSIEGYRDYTIDFILSNGFLKRDDMINHKMKRIIEKIKSLNEKINEKIKNIKSFYYKELLMDDLLTNISDFMADVDMPKYKEKTYFEIEKYFQNIDINKKEIEETKKQITYFVAMLYGCIHSITYEQYNLSIPIINNYVVK